MKIDGREVLVCDCEGTMPLDGAALTRACAKAGLEGDLVLASHLCRTHIDRFMKAVGTGEPLTIACTQEAPLFAEAANEIRADADLRFVNIRERAGWSEEAGKATPKIAALLAESAEDAKPTSTISMQSSGMALVYGIVTLPFAFWLMLTFFEEVPVELEEAALIEGATPWRVFARVTLPLVKPALATTLLFVFILNWSDYVLALMLTRREWVTVPVFMNDLNSAQTGQLYGAKAALGLIAIVPPLILGVLIRKHLVRGLTFGALKQ